ncbi:MAG: hypothetical protein LQ350_007204 [Teloschistes chrysophthalmus]|nr:MAG: hypothetical protein LQ350_007204 [Niorma chrysophthalma]
MTVTTKPAISPQCLGLLRQLVGIRSVGSKNPFHQQIRGKKKSTKGPHLVNVRLLEDIQGYGRKGSIIPVAPGRMRNIYYPQSKAEYVTQAQMRSMGQKDAVFERDFSFGLVKPQEKALPEEKEEPQRSAEVIEALLPRSLIFHRVPIEASMPGPEAPKPVASSINAIGGETPMQRTPEPKKPSADIPIFGSVTPADIVDSIKAVLANDKEGANLVVSSEEIHILHGSNDEVANEEAGVKVDRLKSLGDYRFEIRLKGVGPVRRLVRIVPEEPDKS